MTHLLTQLELMPSFLEVHVSKKSRSEYTSLAKKGCNWIAVKPKSTGSLENKYFGFNAHI